MARRGGHVRTLGGVAGRWHTKLEDHTWNPPSQHLHLGLPAFRIGRKQLSVVLVTAFATAA